MSTLEKAINLLEDMPEQTAETVYAFMLSIRPKKVAHRMYEKKTAYAMNATADTEVANKTINQ